MCCSRVVECHSSDIEERHAAAKCFHSYCINYISSITSIASKRISRVAFEQGPSGHAVAVILQKLVFTDISNCFALLRAISTACSQGICMAKSPGSANRWVVSTLPRLFNRSLHVPLSQ